LRRADLPITGMSCASCAAAVDRSLARTPGVATAHVNIATKTATVHYDPSVSTPDDLARSVHNAGYEAVLPPPAPATAPHHHAAHDHSGHADADDHSAHLHVNAAEQRLLLRKVIIGAILSLPLLVIGMSHGAIPAFNAP